MIACALRLGSQNYIRYRTDPLNLSLYFLYPYSDSPSFFLTACHKRTCLLGHCPVPRIHLVGFWLTSCCEAKPTFRGEPHDFVHNESSERSTNLDFNSLRYLSAVGIRDFFLAAEATGVPRKEPNNLRHLAPYYYSFFKRDVG